MTEYGLGILHPGCCIAILADGVDPKAPRDDDDLWYGVYLETGADEDRRLYMKIAWFYNQDHAMEKFGARKDRRFRDTYVYALYFVFTA